MDPFSISIVVSAMAGAAAQSLDSVASSTYQTLKQQLSEKFAGTKDKQVADLILEKYEETPETWKGPLEAELAKVEDDAHIIATAQKLAALVTPKDAAYDRIASDANATRRQLEQFNEQARGQAKQWSQFSLIAAILGFLVILGGIIAVLTLNTTAGLITSVAGLIPEVAAALFFQQAKDANARIDNITDKLLKIENIHRAIEIALTVDDSSQNHIKETIILQMLNVHDKE